MQVWIYSRDADGERKVLLLKTRIQRGAYWQPVTGKVEDGEALDDAAAREAMEESGLVFPQKPESLNLQFAFKGRWGPAIEHAFALQAPDGCPPVRVDVQEHSDYRWVTPDEALPLLKFDINAQALRTLMAGWQRDAGR